MRLRTKSSAAEEATTPPLDDESFLKAIADFLEDHGRDEGGLSDAPRADFKRDAERLRRMVAALLAAPDDTRRLDALERFARQNANPDWGTAPVVELECWCEPECAEEIAFTVMGPQTRFGYRQGNGENIRAAIADAVAWEGAENLHDVNAEEPTARAVASTLPGAEPKQKPAHDETGWQPGDGKPG